MARRSKRIVKEKRELILKEGLLSYLFIQSSRRGTISIIIEDTGEVKIYAPLYSPEKDIQAFIREKGKWIFAKVEEAKEHQEFLSQKAFDHGHHFLFMQQNQII